MYPNPQDVLPLAAGFAVAHYHAMAERLAAASVAGAHAVASWAAGIDGIGRYPERLAEYAHRQLEPSPDRAGTARDVVARVYGFTSWPLFESALMALDDPALPSAKFERAADAIVTGALDVLQSLLQESPSLVQERSLRSHRATLLHYVAANGVENFRQRTPTNIVAITSLLLDAGADVNATCDVYGGDADTLGLVATSAHPRERGVQPALIEHLVQRGAALQARMVRDCLANGCPEAAAQLGALLLARGDRLGLSDLAGMGREDMLAGALPEANDEQRFEALEYAAWYGHTAVMRTLIDLGVPASIVRGQERKTALHVAAYAGHPSAVALLLARGAAVNATDATWQCTPLVWALHAWLADGRTPSAAYRDIVCQLLDAGATVSRDALGYERLADEAEIKSMLEARAAT